MAMNIDEMNIKENFMCTNVNKHAGPVSNNANLLADNMQDFLLSSACVDRCEFSIYTINLKRT